MAESLEDLGALVLDLARRVSKGEGVYLHCWGGRGRTGLVAACLLGALYSEMEAEEALQRVQQYYDLREPERGGLSPETEEQKQQVREWFRVHRLRGGMAQASSRRAVLGSAMAAAAVLSPVPTSQAADSRCVSDRCDVGELMAAPHVPARLREALRLSLRVVRRSRGARTLGEQVSFSRACYSRAWVAPRHRPIRSMS